MTTFSYLSALSTTDIQAYSKELPVFYQKLRDLNSSLNSLLSGKLIAKGYTIYLRSAPDSELIKASVDDLNSYMQSLDLAAAYHDRFIGGYDTRVPDFAAEIRTLKRHVGRIKDMTKQ